MSSRSSLLNRPMTKNPSRQVKRPGICPTDKHAWVVFSTILDEVSLFCQCINCGALGTVNDPTKEEWDEAFHAPSHPYGWQDNSRVVLRGGVLPWDNWCVRKLSLAGN